MHLAQRVICVFTRTYTARVMQAAAKRVKLDGSSSAEQGISTAEDAGAVAEEKPSIRHIDYKPSITEHQVGIREYVTKNLRGFSGTMKLRFADFLVNEIARDGSVVRMEETDSEESVEDGLGSAEVVEDVKSGPDIDGFLERLKDYASPEELEAVRALISDPQPTSGTQLASVRLAGQMDKEQRTAIHTLVSRHVPTLCESSTSDGCIVLSRGPGTSNPKKRKRIARNSWAQKGGEFCLFHLYKENRDTMEAINIVAKIMRVSTRTFGFAGTKDKRGITVQRITAHKMELERLRGVNSRLRGMQLGNFRYVEKGLRLGDLSGNRFGIVLRDVKAQDEKNIHEALSSLRENGFINYYGLQRFGTSTISTHEAGKLLLSGKIKEALDLILMHKGDEREDVKKARDVWLNEKDPKKALDIFPKYCQAERAVLGSFVRFGEANAAAALQAIPRPLRLMYVHAYQSYVWNCMASERIQLGLQPIVGDLVVRSSQTSVATTKPAESLSENVAESDEEDGEGDNGGGSTSLRTSETTFVTEENIANFKMEDVVLPLPGYDVEYPRNSLRNMYVDLMKVDGLDPFDMRRKGNRDLSLSGGYRSIVSKAKDVDWSVVRYDDLTLPLVEDIAGPIVNAVPEGQSTAVVVRLSLASSQYATMALREVLRENTESMSFDVASETVKSSDDVAP
ncbi:pseudouridine synthase [Cladochytrium replicatum]|nr:pseudouridine synthase [Cladochytrium replicatum]